MDINTITEESPDAGNPVVARSIYEAVKQMDNLEMATGEVLDDLCGTISASDISVAIDNATPATAEQLAAEKERPKSSGGNSRRRREQRKTPSGRITADKLTTVGKSKEKEQAPAGKRVKYSSGAAAATSTTEESVAGRKSRTGSFANLPSASVALKRGHHQTNQSCPQIYLQEQTRLSNLEKARAYGNRASEHNKSAVNRSANSPTKAAF